MFNHLGCCCECLECVCFFPLQHLFSCLLSLFFPKPLFFCFLFLVFFFLFSKFRPLSSLSAAPVPKLLLFILAYFFPFFYHCSRSVLVNNIYKLFCLSFLLKHIPRYFTWQLLKMRLNCILVILTDFLKYIKDLSMLQIFNKDLS